MCKKSKENYIIDLPIDYNEYTESIDCLTKYNGMIKKQNIIKNTTKFYLSYLL